MKRIKRAVCLILLACLAGSFVSCAPRNQMGERQPAPTNLSVPKRRERQMKQGDIFVSPQGNDSGDGSREAPVRSPKRAVELARKLQQKEKVIYFENGVYPITTLTLAPEDSGLTFFAENEAIFHGGFPLDPADFEPYQGNIRVLDLEKYGVTAEQIGPVRAFGQYNTAEKYDASGGLYCELFSDNRRMTLSRYPNEGTYLKTGKILDNGDAKEVYTKQGTKTNAAWEKTKFPRGGTFEVEKELAARVRSWKNSPDIWMFGYFQYDWADSATPLKYAGNDSVTTEYASVYGFKEDMPYYFFNVLEELDEENEWYIDREQLKLYFIPPVGFEQKPLEISLSTGDLVAMAGAEHVTFDGITFTGTRASGIHGMGNDLSIQSCTLKNIGETAIDLTGERIRVEDNVITATGKAGVVLTGGDRAALRSSQNIVTNNEIFDWSQVYRTYQAAVSLNGVGGVCSHNEIYRAPHEAITYTGNNHVIEYNVIHDVVLESSDAGAIYAGRSWSSYGNVIRYNCIYNIGSGAFTPSGIYFDDALSGQEAYGNFLLNIPGNGFLIGGGRDMKIENNLIVNAGTPIWYDDRAIEGIEDGGWFTHAKTPGAGLWATLREVDIHSETWAAAYPQLAKVTDDFESRKDASFAANPADSSVRHNVAVGEKKSLGEFSKRVEQYSAVAENSVFRLKEASFQGDNRYEFNDPPQGFERLPFEQMGRIATCREKNGV